MKKAFIYSLVFILSSCAIIGCKKDFLSSPPVNVVDANAIFSNQLQTSGFLANIYSELNGGPDQFGSGTGFTNMCDEAEAGYAYYSSNASNVASFDGSNNPDNASLNDNYRKIRKCNVMLSNKDLMTFTPALKDQYLAEAQFLRAFFYTELLKRFGGMPIITSPIDYEQIKDLNAQAELKKDIKRNTYAECVDFIVKQLDSAAAVLPWSPPSDLERGRATAAACAALKARVLLVAASPLFNGSGNAVTGYPAADPARWQRALEAARDFFSKNAAGSNWYSLYNGGFDKLFTESRDPNNKEIIWYRQGSSQSNTYFNPPNRMGGFTGFDVSLNLVDKFEMKSGLAINDAGSGYDEQKWWVNRDPRLAFSVLKNGDLWRGNTMEFWARDLSNNNLPGLDWGTQNQTAMTIKKFQRPDNSAIVTKYHYIRLADVYLMLAEAANEVNGPTTEAYTAINTVRNRPTVVMPPLPAGLSKEQMRLRIQNERAVEMAFENQRYFDVRRWKIAEQTDNGPFQGFVVEKNGTTITHKRYTLEVRKFVPRMYLYPIPDVEIFKGADIVQNPGY
ncbi:RagB/SusD family nutrient uptake outer membrane protein [Pedobacter nutrimenti]|uniref:RagB/SusD family nutrient uptake outer membrane protein n=1 Tax=Pedobacter nutrimenti TaxID=1241337 RepID=UPI00292EF83D|nr:RagB/SusD family nutrient uptake outer membrane protein [Pedobacter nutrimenti]